MAYQTLVELLMKLICAHILQKSNDIEMKTMINTLEKDKEQALKKAQKEKDQIVAQLQAAVRENEDKQREIIELNEMLEKKDAEVSGCETAVLH